MNSLKHQCLNCLKGLIAAMLYAMLQGCTGMVVGAAVGTATTVAVETAKVPFKVTGAAIDLVMDDDEED